MGTRGIKIGWVQIPGWDHTADRLHLASNTIIPIYDASIPVVDHIPDASNPHLSTVAVDQNGRLLYDDSGSFGIDAFLAELDADWDEGLPIAVSQLACMPQCKCRWFRCWQLPCKHIWAHHLYFNSLSPTLFTELFGLWHEHGFEVYDQLSAPTPQNGVSVGVSRRANLKFKALMETLKNVQYNIMDLVQSFGGSIEEAEKDQELLMDFVYDMIGGIDKYDIQSLLSMIRGRYGT
jgi:hypothetical protein